MFLWILRRGASCLTGDQNQGRRRVALFEWVSPTGAIKDSAGTATPLPITRRWSAAERLRLQPPRCCACAAMVETGGEAIAPWKPTPAGHSFEPAQSLLTTSNSSLPVTNRRWTPSGRADHGAGTTMGPEHNLFDPQAASAHQSSCVRRSSTTMRWTSCARSTAAWFPTALWHGVPRAEGEQGLAQALNAVRASAAAWRKAVRS